jgi:hypothetical protein
MSSYNNSSELTRQNKDNGENGLDFFFAPGCSSSLEFPLIANQLIYKPDKIFINAVADVEPLLQRKNATTDNANVVNVAPLCLIVGVEITINKKFGGVDSVVTATSPGA